MFNYIVETTSTQVSYIGSSEELFVHLYLLWLLAIIYLAHVIHTSVIRARNICARGGGQTGRVISSPCPWLHARSMDVHPWELCVRTYDAHGWIIVGMALMGTAVLDRWSQPWCITLLWRRQLLDPVRGGHLCCTDLSGTSIVLQREHSQTL